MDADGNLTPAELAMLLGDPIAAAEHYDGAGEAASTAEPVEQTVRALSTAVRALAARIDHLEALVKELRLEALDRDKAGSSAPPTTAAERIDRLDRAFYTAAVSDGDEPRLSRIERFGRRRGQV